MQLQLDKSVIKALSNDTRVSILKALKSRRHTQSELASYLELSVPTVKEHLSALEKAGLVEMHDEGRKWKYFSLTKKAKGIFEPEQFNIFLVLGTFLLSVAGGLFTFFNRFQPKGMGGSPKMFVQESVQAASDEVLMAARAPAADIVLPPEPSFLSQYGYLVFVFIAIVSVALLLFFIFRRQKKRALLGKYLNKK